MVTIGGCLFLYSDFQEGMDRISRKVVLRAANSYCLQERGTWIAYRNQIVKENIAPFSFCPSAQIFPP